MAERGAVQLTGVHAISALGRGAEAQLAGVLAATPAFAPVGRFDTGPRRVDAAATLPDVGRLPDELAEAVEVACADAGLNAAGRAGAALLLAVHGGVGVPELATGLARRTGLGGGTRAYTTACVSATSAVAAGAALLARGDRDAVVVAAGYLVEPDQYALFDTGRALATDGAVRPFSAGRTGLLLGDGVAAVVLQRARSARDPVADLLGWGRTGDAFHPCQPEPSGRGLARAARAALDRAGLPPEAVGYVNANATGTAGSDASEAAALGAVFGAAGVPVSSTKAVHGHALEASGLLELVVTVQVLRHGKLPVNAGWRGPDPHCPVDVILDAPRPAATRYALTLNAAFGGANTALLVGAA
ncbi:beta-ketoacyl synthase N-terminal-like domain-containing protein [Micromonospora endolithica]|uniref:Beta-ketoacyl-[acyl-carrier-protein] synthase family protein n=1 Tax=Micromonospora endolithica TaxID=230091 RepID=A0A3A9YXK0_9ACTN|nr:beta-ketoacyl synthase N-terminal-like domain-containing protein [Micromonospora endolithica]RKN40600.1 beta-ketoacyl-[acyl-carrier-protein] synthase family protein [Micromonospora endolithica]TWJ21682.1 3-oxoacyl-(acyl-carrier-protein) synthase [Micromonospora endolithica]